MMDKKEARGNMRMGVTLFMVLICMMGVAFVWAAIYLNVVGSS